MAQTFVTATTGVLACLVAMEHVPRSLTRLVQACIPLAKAWRELTARTGRGSRLMSRPRRNRSSVGLPERPAFEFKSVGVT
jgi:hypothetical protein